MYPGKQGNLYLTFLTKESDRRKNGGYRYLITTPTLSHSAFRTKEGLKHWLLDTGLRLGKRAPHQWHTFPLVGTYYDDMIMNEAEFERLHASGKYRESYILSNGEYTRSLVKDGHIVYLNPNCRNRAVLTYRYE